MNYRLSIVGVGYEEFDTVEAAVAYAQSKYSTSAWAVYTRVGDLVTKSAYY